MIWFICIAIVLFLFLLPSIIQNFLYEKSSYYQITKKPLSTLNKGEVGEYLIWEELQRFEEEGGKFLFNLYIPKPNGETTEVDVVFIHPKGFFVFESKNYKGWIFGSEKTDIGHRACQWVEVGKVIKNSFIIR